MEGKQQRSSQEKAAILLQLLGEDVAAKVIQSLPMSDVHKMAQAIINMPPATVEEAREVAREFSEVIRQSGGLLMPGDEFAKAVVYRAFDKVSATRLLDTVRSSKDQDTFEELNRTDPRVISEFTKAEHPQTTALILAHLEPAVAGKVLSHLPEAARSEVVLRLARIKEVSPTILEEITEALQTDLLNVARGGAEVGGLKKVAEILNHADKAVEAEIMNGIQKEDPALAAGIQQLMFVFDDIVTLDDKAVQEILREIDVKMLAKALRGAGEEVQEKIFKNMSQRAVQVLQEDMEALGPTRLSEVEESQMEIIKVILRLRDEGRVVIHGPGEEDVFV